uniref:Uncharacterized protein n=1 Tax=Avena sativa TaxID=4498 RepID=A0ACD5X0J4_AVESA
MVEAAAASAGFGRMKGGRIDRLEVENFKSYKGTHTIGPFFDFTAVVGPNGAGKSNLMDAISFVLGVSSAHLRGAQLRDLVYAFDDADREAAHRASVRLVYRIPGTGAVELHFARSITITTASGGGGSEYRIDGRVVTWEHYNARLRSLGILVKARNFLVFQGDVESVASRNPKELTALLEQISGSDELRKEYGELESHKRTAEEKSALVCREKRTIAEERKEKKAEKAEAEKHLRLQQELKLLRTEHLLWQLYTIQGDTKNIEAQLEEERRSLQQAKDENRSYGQDLAAKQKEQSAYLKKLILCEESMAKKMNLDIDERQPQLLGLEEQISRLKSEIERCNREIGRKKGANKKHLEETKRLDSALVDITAALEELNEQVQDKRSQLQLGNDQLQEYHRIKEDAETRTAKLRDEKEILDKELIVNVEARNNLEGNMQQLCNRRDGISSLEIELQTRLTMILHSVTMHKDELASLREEHDKIVKERQSSGARYQTLNQRVYEIDAQLRELKAHKHESERDAQCSEIVRSLKQLFPGDWSPWSHD